jgi:hypothetical protein
MIGAPSGCLLGSHRLQYFHVIWSSRRENPSDDASVVVKCPSFVGLVGPN